MLCVGTARGELWLSSWRRTQRRGRRGGWRGESYTFALILVLVFDTWSLFWFCCGRGLFLVLVFDTWSSVWFWCGCSVFGFCPGLGFG